MSSLLVCRRHTHPPLEEWYKYYPSPIYILRLLLQIATIRCDRDTARKRSNRESLQAWWQVASRGHFPLLFVPPAHSNNCVCRASNTLPATCSLGSCRISLVLSRLLTFIARVMAASRCLPPVCLSHAAPRMWLCWAIFYPLLRVPCQPHAACPPALSAHAASHLMC